MRKPNPMAKDLRQPKYRSQVIPDKKKPKLYRKAKHKKRRPREGPLVLNGGNFCIIQILFLYASSKCGASIKGLLPSDLLKST
jgi:hypothetical protein